MFFGPQSDNARKRIDRQIFESFLNVEKAVEHEGDNDPNFKWCA